MRRSLMLLALVSSVALVASACSPKKDTGFPAPSPSSSSPSPSATPTTPIEVAGPINIVDNAFTPMQGIVHPGQKITWSQTGAAPHTVTFDTLKIDSDPTCNGSDPSKCLKTGSTFSATITKPGKYHYYCRVHGAPGQDIGMVRYIVVQ